MLSNMLNMPINYQTNGMKWYLLGLTRHSKYGGKCSKNQSSVYSTNT